jgi:hypothetical protein
MINPNDSNFCYIPWIYFHDAYTVFLAKRYIDFLADEAKRLKIEQNAMI